MTKQEVMEQYDVKDGVIKSAGKFENEMAYVPYFNDMLMNGDGETMDLGGDEGYTVLNITAEDAVEFPELQSEVGNVILLFSNSLGFVSGQVMTREDADALLAEIQEEIDAELGIEDDGYDSDIQGAGLVLRLTDTEDASGYKYYKGNNGKWYFKVDDVMHVCTEDGEPLHPVQNFTIEGRIK